jgi:hypothetical protein
VAIGLGLASVRCPVLIAARCRFPLLANALILMHHQMSAARTARLRQQLANVDEMIRLVKRTPLHTSLTS